MEDGEEDFLDERWGRGRGGEGEMYIWNGMESIRAALLLQQSVMRHKLKVVDRQMIQSRGDWTIVENDFCVENVFGHTMSMRSDTTYPSPYRLPGLPIYPIFAISPNESQQLHSIPSHSTVAFSVLPPNG